MRERRFSYANVGTYKESFEVGVTQNKFVQITFLRSLSKASFKLNIRLLSLIFAALLCAIEATRRLVFFVGLEFGSPRFASLCETKLFACERGQIARKKVRHFVFLIIYFRLQTGITENLKIFLLIYQVLVNIEILQLGLGIQWTGEE